MPTMPAMISTDRMKHRFDLLGLMMVLLAVLNGYEVYVHLSRSWLRASIDAVFAVFGLAIATCMFYIRFRGARQTPESIEPNQNRRTRFLVWFSTVLGVIIALAILLSWLYK